MLRETNTRALRALSGALVDVFARGAPGHA
jgi:hypothetical protein